MEIGNPQFPKYESINHAFEHISDAHEPWAKMAKDPVYHYTSCLPLHAIPYTARHT